MAQYLVTWEIEVDADDPRAAAAQARQLQQDPSSAVVFDVTLLDGDGNNPGNQTVRVDLDEAEDDDGERTECGCCGESWNQSESDASDPDAYCSAACERGDLG